MKNGRTHTRDRILAGAATVFAEHGFAGTTITKIARAAQVSETLIYQYFGAKEDLLLTLPMVKIAEVADIIDDHLFGIRGSLCQLRKFVWVYVRHLTENPLYAKIALLHLKTNKAFMNTEAYKVVQQFYEKITDIIKMGQKSGEIRVDINPYNARVLIIGGIEHLITRWLLKDCSYDFMDHLDEIYNLIEDALRTRPEEVASRPGEIVKAPSNGKLVSKH